MAEPFLGEVRIFPISYVPRGWLSCEGQLLPIRQNQALYSLLGTVYGGDGITTFALPDLRGRVPIHVSSSLPLGTKAGEETHTLTTNEMPQHTHQINGSSNPASAPSPQGNVWAGQDNLYAAGATVAMNQAALSTAGSGQAHNNMQPYLAVRFCIATQGIFPSRN
ncbi:phage tail protein [Lysinibacillus piscis]|uniref:Tail Collar domain-containing protein n=1 Tax=Lysinibacillus piscis TaxID=2518931 RepID=A0ABQ5NG11_9BACI|nr:tail fiber protein [Lysinibacillus sp. KH24]GLC86989.1 tail Collar domain-containing protein [Lysinibacillus sp. KH24]